MLNGMQVFVSEKLYKMYWKETNRERYLKRLDWKNRLIYLSDYDTSSSLFVENIRDDTINIEYTIIMKECLEKLYDALSTLDFVELLVITNIYFQGMSIRECAKLYNVSTKKILNVRDKTLKKLKIVLEQN